MSAGGTPSRSVSGYYGGTIPWCSISDISSSGKFLIRTVESLTHLGIENSSAKLIPADAILFAMYASIGECTLATTSLATSQAILGIYNLKEFDREYLYYYLCSQKATFMNQGQTGTQSNLSKEIVSNVQLPQPDIEAQCRIANTLSSIDANIAALQTLISKYEDIKKATVKLLLTPKKGWQEKSLGALAFIKTGGRNTQDATASGRYPFFVRSPNVERIDTYSYDGEAILVAGDGVGAGKVFHYINGKHDCHQRVYRIRDFHPEVMGRFIYCVLSEQFPSYMERRNDKASVDSLRLPAFKSFPVFYPDVNEQKRIVTILDSIDDTISELRAQLAKSQSIKQGMMSYFFG